MANVLPPEERKRLGRRFRARFMLVGALVLCLSAGVAMLALLPSLISVRIAEGTLQKTQAALSERIQDDQIKQVRATALVASLQGALATSSPIEVVGVAIGLKPGAARLSSVSYSKGKIVLSGASPQRDAVSTYRDALEKSDRFTSVTVPVAALIGTQEGRFTITLTGAF